METKMRPKRNREEENEELTNCLFSSFGNFPGEEGEEEEEEKTVFSLLPSHEITVFKKISGKQRKLNFADARKQKCIVVARLLAAFEKYLR